MLNTAEATTDASVWYALEGTGTGVAVDVSQSDYTAGVRVGVGTQGNLTTISGTYTCTNGDFIEVFVDARSRVGRLIIFGSGGFFDFSTCEGYCLAEWERSTGKCCIHHLKE